MLKFSVSVMNLQKVRLEHQPRTAQDGQADRQTERLMIRGNNPFEPDPFNLQLDAAPAWEQRCPISGVAFRTLRLSFHDT
jgi:hypothetical protein